jgi:hypothetical protein
MLILIKFISILSLIVWLGAVVFFSFVVAPCLFSSLGSELAGRSLGKIFPIYYALGTIFGLLLFFGTGLWAWIEDEWSWNVLLSFTTCALMLGANLYAGYEIAPKIREIKLKLASEIPHEKDLFQGEFNRLHRLSVILNGVVLLLGLIFTVFLVLRI